MVRANMETDSSNSCYEGTTSQTIKMLLEHKCTLGSTTQWLHTHCAGSFLPDPRRHRGRYCSVR